MTQQQQHEEEKNDEKKQYLSKSEAKVDSIVFWLKMIIFASFLSFKFCCQKYIHQHGTVKPLWLIPTISSVAILVNSMLSLSLFSC